MLGQWWSAIRNPGAALLCVEAVAREVDRSMIVAVVNEPSDVSSRDIERLSDAVGTVVLNERPAGYGANINSGARRLPADVRYLLFLNDDAIVQQDAVSTLRRTLESAPRIALVGPQFVDRDGRAQPSQHRFPSLASELVEALLLPAVLGEWLGQRYVDVPAELAHLGDICPLGAALLIRAEPFFELGGFDEHYFLYSEETDLAYRLKQRGWGSSSCADAVVAHVGGQSTAGRFDRFAGLSRWRYIRTHWSRPTRCALVALLPLAYAWNTAYIASRIVIRPQSLDGKVALWRARWARRPLPTLRSRPARPGRADGSWSKLRSPA